VDTADTPDAKPGYAKINADDTPEEIEYKIKTAFGPLRDLREAIDKWLIINSKADD
jgi:hypothetical protein